MVLGIGNPILSDDAVGFQVAERLRKALKNRKSVTVKETSVSGLSLLDEITGYERLIIVDAIQTRDGKPGDIYRLTPADFKVGRMAVIHDVGLFSALELARKLDMEVPREVVIFAIEAKDIATFSEKCSPEVEEAIPKAVDMVLREVG